MRILQALCPRQHRHGGIRVTRVRPMRWSALNASGSREAYFCTSSVAGIHLGVPGYFPQVAVGVLERTGVPAPERVVRRIGYDGSGSLRLFDKRIDLSFATHKVSQRTFGRAARAQRHFRLMGHVLARPDRQLLAVRQIKKYDGPMWVLGADDASCGQPESIPIECQCTLKIVDTECNDGDPRSHTRPPARLGYEPCAPLS